MNTLSNTSILHKTKVSKAVCASLSAINDGKYPIEIEGSEGAFSAILIAQIYNEKKEQFFVIVPSETAADDIMLDFASTGIPCIKFPWWGTAPYRELTQQAAVFGERVKVLNELSFGKPGIVVICERAVGECQHGYIFVVKTPYLQRGRLIVKLIFSAGIVNVAVVFDNAICKTDNRVMRNPYQM